MKTLLVATFLTLSVTGALAQDYQALMQRAKEMAAQQNLGPSEFAKPANADELVPLPVNAATQDLTPMQTLMQRATAIANGQTDGWNSGNSVCSNCWQ